MRIAFLIGSCLLYLSFAKAQEKLPLRGDLKGAPLIRVNQPYSFLNSPSGYGKLKEFKINYSNSPVTFKEERNSAWFITEVLSGGILSFDLTPHQVKDDYDWMLFKFNPDLEKNLQNGSVHPLRSNNARNAPSLFSKTGLGSNSKSNFVNSGPGNNYSLPLRVKKGDKLALVLDNVYGGKGFDIMISVKPDWAGQFGFLEGTIKDRYTKNSLSADIVIEDDSTGMLIGKTKSDPLNGRYKLKVPFGRPVNITASHPAYFFATADTLIKANSQLNFLLDTPVSGNKRVLLNIHFYPNKDLILPSSFPELDRLLSFMKNRPEWVVKITGHTNSNVFAPVNYLQQLSLSRAMAVKKYLMNNSIAEKRISCSGLGGNSPLVITKVAAEGLKNLRVEVTLVKSE